MKDGDSEYLTEKALDNPILTELNNISREFVGVGFLVVFPRKDGWGQFCLGGSKCRPEFCRLIQGAKQGAKHCGMCHILMTVAACTHGTIEQRCHAGVWVLVTPVSSPDTHALALLSTCVFAPAVNSQAWTEARARGKKLGADLKQLKKAYDKLPRLTSDQIKLVRAIMAVAGKGVKEIRARILMEKQLADLLGRHKSKTRVQEAMEQELMSAVSILPPREGDVSRKKRRKKKKVPVLIDVVANMISDKPSMPFTVSEIAAAARMTPNHFSTLFNRYKGQNFSEFLTQRRIALAKELLRDLTLNIGEVAFKAGYSDPGYFARLFKRKTGRTPSEWREALTVKK